MTKWVKVIGSGGRYEVSDDGQIRSYILRHKGQTGVSDTPQRLIKQLISPFGYLICRLWFPCGVQSVRVSRLVAEHFLGPCPNGMECCHINNIKTDNRAENLKWDTHRNNQVVDGGARGIIGKGENNPMAKLTPEIVLSIREHSKKNKCTHQKTADVFGISRRLASRIISRERWTHI